MSETVTSLSTRIGKIIQAVRIPSLTGARDIGGAAVTQTGRIVIAAGISDGELNHPYKIAVTDDGGATVREVFTLPAEPDVTYHTLGLAYDKEHHVLVSVFGRNKGYVPLDKPYGKTLPFSRDYCGDNSCVLARSWDDGETWVTTEMPLPKPQNSHGIIGDGVYIDGEIIFPHVVGTCDPREQDHRMITFLARLRNIPRQDGSFDHDYEHEFRTLATNEDRDIPYSSETIYIAKADGSGYISFHRDQVGPPYRREYDLDHRPTCEFVRCRAIGFDPRDYDPGHNGPVLLAFGIIRMADGNLLYGSRYYPSEHHRGGNIFMTSRDEGLTWQFKEDYLPWTLDPLQYPNSGWGGNPQMYYGPDGTLIHNTSEQLMYVKERIRKGLPPEGGFALCRFEGFTFDGCTASKDGTGTFSVDASTITRIDDVYISNLVILEAAGLEIEEQDQALLFYSSDATQVSFHYRKVSNQATLKLRITLANKHNQHKPAFEPEIRIV